MSDYSNGKIYKLVSSNGNLCYIGSTTQRLEQRLSKHKCCYKRWKSGTSNFVTSFKLFDDDTEAVIELLERYPCATRKELENRERFYIESIACVNKNIVGRTDQQYYEANKDQIIEYKKQYRKDNKDKIAEYKKQYYETNKDVLNAKHNKKFVCECGGKYSHQNKSQHGRTIKHQTYAKQKSD